jgi:hypothetical protein
MVTGRKPRLTSPLLWAFRTRKSFTNPQSWRCPKSAIRNILHIDILVLQDEVKL